MKVKSTSKKVGGRATGSVAKSKTAAKTAQKSAPKASKGQKAKADRFGGTTKGKAEKPAAQLPRSGWASTEDFKRAARASQQVAGLRAGGLGDRMIVRPMYGLPVPLPLDPGLKGKHLEAAVKGMLGDRRITLAEVSTLIGIAKENGVISKTEKRDLNKLMDDCGQFFDADALRTLQSFVKDQKPMPDPVIRPLYGLVFPVPIPDGMRNKDLKQALAPMIGDRRITLDEVNKLIDLANDNGGLSRTERADLEKVYDQLSSFMEPAAHHRLGQAIGREPVIRPLYGLVMPIPLPDLKSKNLKDAAKDILNDCHITAAEVDSLTKAAMQNGGLSKTERADLNRLLDEIPERFDADAKTRLQAFLNKAGGDGLKVTEARREHIVGALETAEGAGKLTWQAGFPLGARMVEVPLKNENHPDGFSYTALIPVGALSPTASTADPNTVDNAWIRRTGGFAGLTQYAHLDF